MRQLKVFLIICTMMASGVVKAQDPQFTQFYANQVLLNPAFTGAAQGPRLAMNYRRQWSSIPGYFKTFAAAYDQPVMFGKTRHGLGISFMADQAGEGNLTKLDVLLNYSYHLPIGDNGVLRLGLSAGIQQSSIDFFRLRWSDQINPTSGFTNATSEVGGQSRINEDVNAGAVYYNKYVWVGGGISHITEPRQKFISGSPDDKLPMRITAFGGIQIPMSEGKTFSPAIMFRKQGPFTQVDAGAYFNLDPIIFGLWYRNKDAVAGLVGLKKGILSFGYSYDYTISKLGNRATGGSHELSLILEFERTPKSKKKKHKGLPPCPRF